MEEKYAQDCSIGLGEKLLMPADQMRRQFLPSQEVTRNIARFAVRMAQELWVLCVQGSMATGRISPK